MEVYSSLICNFPKLEMINMSFNRYMVKQDVLYLVHIVVIKKELVIDTIHNRYILK